MRKVKKALSILRDKGPAAVMKASLRRWALSGSHVNPDLLAEYQFILLPDNPPVLKYTGGDKLVINWFVLGVGLASGGMFNIFRTIKYLEEQGHVCRVYLVGVERADEASLNELIQKHYFSIKAELKILRGEMAACDALVATCWRTAYYAKNQSNTAQKFYFVQDMEDQFFAQGSVAEFARETYRFGFVGLTAGSWIADTLNKSYGMECFPFGFSYDKSRYSPPNTVAYRRKVLFYARPETERRGFELGMLALSIVAKAHHDVEFVLVGTKENNWITQFPVSCPGVLAVDDLRRLYGECALALVISHTNLSLLPLEIMACGCAIVSNDGPNINWLLNEKVATLVSTRPEDMAEAILALLDTPELLDEKSKLGQDFALTTDWHHEMAKIEIAMFAALREH